MHYASHKYEGHDCTGCEKGTGFSPYPLFGEEPLLFGSYLGMRRRVVSLSEAIRQARPVLYRKYLDNRFTLSEPPCRLNASVVSI
jgi:hypothetical protein